MRCEIMRSFAEEGLTGFVEICALLLCNGSSVSVSGGPFAWADIICALS